MEDPICPECRGSGQQYDKNDNAHQCYRCMGYGYIPIEQYLEEIKQKRSD